MFFALLSLGSSLFGIGEKKEKTFRDSIIGNWTIVGQELTEDAQNKTFNLNIAKDEDNKFSGVLIGEDEDGVPAPVGNVEISMKEDNATYTFSYAAEGADAGEPISFVPVASPSGFTVLGQYQKSTVVVKVLMDRYIELTLVDPETKVISTYTLTKAVVENKQSTLQMMLPMIMMMIMQFFMKGKNPAAMAAAQQGAGAEGAAAPAEGDNK